MMASEAPADESDWLLASDRDYLTQLDHYKQHRDGAREDTEDHNVA
jgi:hypothetical protein